MIQERMIFIHGLEGSNKGVKATLLKNKYPQIIVPNFSGPLDVRMDKLRSILGNLPGWIVIGSSFGGLMGALFTCERPQLVHKLLLFAPALLWADYFIDFPEPVNVPTIIYHGLGDDVVPLPEVRKLSNDLFANLTFHEVDDDHGLYKTVHQIDWKAILGV